MIWQNHETLIRGNPEAQNSILSLIRELKNQLPSELIPHNKPGSESSTAKTAGPNILDTHVLLLLMLGYPTAEVRRYHLKKMKQLLNSTVKNLPEEIHTGPVFYPGTVLANPDEKSQKQISPKDIERLIAISDSLLLYNLFTEDREYLLSGGFDLQLVLSRLWSSLLRDQSSPDALKAETADYHQVMEKAGRVLHMTLGNISYLKSENSWMYEDFRENYRFSEIKETAAWKEIIRKSGIAGSDGWSSLMKKMKMDELHQDGRSQLTDLFTDISPDKQSGSESRLNHLASRWNSTLLYCLGFSLKNRHPVLHPELPGDWNSFCFQFHLRNTVLEIEADRQKFVLHNLTTNSISLILNNRTREIQGNESLSVNF